VVQLPARQTDKGQIASILTLLEKAEETPFLLLQAGYSGSLRRLSSYQPNAEACWYLRRSELLRAIYRTMQMTKLLKFLHLSG